MGRRFNKKELAQIKILSDLGHTPTDIARKLKCSHHTVSKYLDQPKIFEDPGIQERIEKIKKNETNSLYLLGEKSRNRLHELIDAGKTKVIETTAVMDRAFQQRRLLEGQPTQISYSDGIQPEDWGLLSELKKRMVEIMRGKNTPGSLLEPSSPDQIEVRGLPVIHYEKSSPADASNGNDKVERDGE